YMVNAQGAKLTGYQANDRGVLLKGAPVPIQINTQDLSPIATGHVSTQINLDSGSTVPTTVPFNENDPSSYNKQTPVDVYDTLGNPHVMSMYYVKTSAGTWDVYVASDGVEITNKAVAQTSETDPDCVAARAAYATSLTVVPRDQAAIDATSQAAIDYATVAGNVVAAAAATAGATAEQQQAIIDAAASAGATAGINTEQIDALISAAVHVPPVRVGHLNFDSNGALSTALMAPQTLPLTVALPIYPPTGAAPSLSIQLGFSGSTQYGAATSEKRTTQDGYTAGHLQRFSAGSDGIILGQYSNGQSQPLGQIVLANFDNPNGLSPLGNNAWAETSTSGVPLIGTPNSGSLGVLQSSAVENSNVDLTAELVNMITAQRVYQANAQTIKTQDSVLQTLVNLR
ncbi:MAG TPA: flagellar hook protein FlgE, partial [Telluria sp.]|nr:flagellar hook protein FlgE [Telluria sp.]